ncbi:MAG: tetratricopeptide repeat protein [Parasporobacterium sp.]|nr:tetratricopeptide repeat protein [Parasporobacterium sp.]
MAVFVCKQCGGQLEVEPGQIILECEYCGCHMTVDEFYNNPDHGNAVEGRSPKPERQRQYHVRDKSKEPEEKRRIQEHQEELNKIDFWGRIINFIIIGIPLLWILSFIACGNTTHRLDYLNAITHRKAGNYEKAIELFKEAGNYEDSRNQLMETYLAQGEAYMNSGMYDEAITSIKNAGNYKGAADLLSEVYYRKAAVCVRDGDYSGAIYNFEMAGDYRDSLEIIAVLEKLNQEPDKLKKSN